MASEGRGNSVKGAMRVKQARNSGNKRLLVSMTATLQSSLALREDRGAPRLAQGTRMSDRAAGLRRRPLFYCLILAGRS